MAQLRAPLQAPPARPPLYGLIAAAPTAEGGDGRWAGGWEFEPERCGGERIAGVLCAGQTATNMAPEGAPPDGGLVAGDPLWVWAFDRCSTLGSGERDWQGRARRQLALTESRSLARELWRGDLTVAGDVDNPYLASPDTIPVSGPGSSLVTALGCIEAAMATGYSGQQGMVHVAPQLLPHLVQQQLVTRQGTGVWLTPAGHVLVVDAGYTGDGPPLGGDEGVPGEYQAPDDTGQWLYGTPMLRVRLDGVQIIPGSLDEARNMAAAMNLQRKVNTVVVYAGRLAGIQWDNLCGTYAAHVAIPACDYTEGG